MESAPPMEWPVTSSGQPGKRRAASARASEVLQCTYVAASIIPSCTCAPDQAPCLNRGSTACSARATRPPCLVVRTCKCALESATLDSTSKTGVRILSYQGWTANLALRAQQRHFHGRRAHIQQHVANLQRAPAHEYACAQTMLYSSTGAKES